MKTTIQFVEYRHYYRDEKSSKQAERLDRNRCVSSLSGIIGADIQYEEPFWELLNKNVARIAMYSNEWLDSREERIEYYCLYNWL